MILINYPINIYQQHVNLMPEVVSKMKIRFYNSFNEKEIEDEESQIFEIKRYLINDLFASKVSYLANIPFVWSHYLQWNNKDDLNSIIFELEANQWKDNVIDPYSIKQLSFSKLTSISSISNIRRNNLESLKVLNQIAINHINNPKEFVVSKNGIKFKTPKIISSKTTVVGNSLKSYNTILYNNIVLFPIPLTQGVHNTSVFKVAIFNDNEEDVERDIAILPKKLLGLPLRGKDSLELEYVPNDNQEIIQGYTIIGTIDIINNTYYDIETKETVKSISNNSQRGYIIPFNFMGNLNMVAELDLNSDFKDLKLGIHQKIDKRYLDHFEGVKKLSIKYGTESNQGVSSYLIKNADFAKVANVLETLEAIRSIAKKEENEK